MDLNISYTVLATAAATLLGLLFIAIQPNIERLSNDPQNHWKALATSTFHIYTWVFLLSIFSFIPAFRSPSFLIAALLEIWRQLRACAPVWQLKTKGRFERVRRSEEHT